MGHMSYLSYKSYFFYYCANSLKCTAAIIDASAAMWVSIGRVRSPVKLRILLHSHPPNAHAASTGIAQ